MQSLYYDRAASVEEALVVARKTNARFIGGGTNLLDLMKGGVEHAERLVDINRLGLDMIATLPSGGIRIGALVRNSDAANHASVKERYPLLSQALLSGASAQLLNIATTGAI